MPHSFQSIALVGNAKDLRVAECMLGLAAHFHTRGVPVLVDPGVGLAFKANSVVLCPEQSFATRADLILLPSAATARCCMQQDWSPAIRCPCSA